MNMRMLFTYLQLTWPETLGKGDRQPRGGKSLTKTHGANSNEYRSRPASDRSELLTMDSPQDLWVLQNLKP